MIPQWVHRVLRPLPEDVRRATLAAIRTAPFVGVLGAVYALLAPQHFQSTAAFIAESQNNRSLPAGLGALADQFGVGASLGSSQSPAYFADLLETRSILEPMLDMSMHLSNDTTSRPLIDLLHAKGRNVRDRRERAVRRLRRSISVSPDVKTNVITLAVDARDPLLASEIAQALLSGLDQFNVSVRRSRARNEREFLEGRVADVQDQLRAAEDSLQQFLTSNRGDVRASPSLSFREARLRRQVELTQTRFVELQRQLDQARVQEVRDTPAITILDKPNVPARRYKPNRKLVTIVITLLGMSIAYGLSRLRSHIAKRTIGAG
ncbi:MAG TPA: hypothetical protein VLV16_00585 [Gemmatimonadales bacterium]|nr:hypothetical protein [Gemmatimonadales bacterium]